MLPTKFRFIWPSGFSGEDFLEIDQSEIRITWGGHLFLTYQDEMSNLYRGSTIYASYQVSVHLAKRFQRRRFLEINRSETRIACGDHVCSRIGSKWAISIEDLP